MFGLLCLHFSHEELFCQVSKSSASNKALNTTVKLTRISVWQFFKTGKLGFVFCEIPSGFWHLGQQTAYKRNGIN